MVRELRWRHFLVFWSARLALRAPVKTHPLVECGVCDGLTIHFALRASPESDAFLYDSWGSADKYDYLSLEQTQRHLAAFAGRTRFIQGLIPDSLRLGMPDSCAWFRIDLNAAEPTRAALEAFYDRMPPRGVVLFDDYGWPDRRETKRAVDQFFAGKRGQLLQFPTGQALWLND
jgi:O-methyltransferase